eukprot:1032492-Prymnesium_polylepis.1
MPGNVPISETQGALVAVGIDQPPSGRLGDVPLERCDTTPFCRSAPTLPAIVRNGPELGGEMTLS